jgi:hypothetical protein
MEYTEVNAPLGDTRGEVLEALAGTGLWILVMAEMTMEEGADRPSLNMKIETGSLLSDNSTIRTLLTKVLDALPEGS